jgi:ATP-dependent Clp protease protease subunit
MPKPVNKFQTPSKNITNVLENNTIQLYGVIGRWDEIDWVPFQDAFRQMDVQGSTITILVNCYGGNTFSGLAIFDLIKNAKAQVIIINEGIAASMGGVLLQATKKENRKATKNSRVMIHRASGMCGGDAEDMRNYAQMLEDEEAKILQIFIDSTGQPEATVKGWMKTGVDKWFNANQALEAGLIGEIIEPQGTNNVFTETDFENKTEDEILNIFNNYKPKTEMNKLRIAIAAMLMQNGLAVPQESDSDEKWAEAMNNCVKGISNKLTEANNKLVDVAKNAATSLIENAQATGKLPADLDATKKQELINNATSNFDLVSNMLNVIPSTTPAPTNTATDVNAILTGANAGGKVAPLATNGIAADRVTWNITDWAKKDPEGLNNLAKVNPAAYQDLLNKAEAALIENGTKIPKN